jgi:uncharacterized membrane protein
MLEKIAKILFGDSYENMENQEKTTLLYLIGAVCIILGVIVVYFKKNLIDDLILIGILSLAFSPRVRKYYNNIFAAKDTPTDPEQTDTEE